MTGDSDPIAGETVSTDEELRDDYEVDEKRIEAKVNSIRAKVAALAATTIMEAELPNKCTKNQVSIKWTIIKGEAHYDIRISCGLCGRNLAVPSLGNTVCNGSLPIT